MAIKTAAQMFGDGAGNGAAVPYSTTNPPGTSAANRGIQFGEQLTAAIANRTHYALALNDEDLNTRLVPFETTGLDAAYRLGNVATPGGGRIIEIDAGPVEAQSALTTLYTRDRFNTLIRANMNDDVIAGSVGFDAVSEHSAQPYANYVARRTMDRTGKSVSDPAAATLNLGASNVAGLTITGATTSGLIIPGVDIVEIVDTAYAGFYTVYYIAINQYTLINIRGTSPSFAANTACNVRLWRQTFRVSTRPTYVTSPGGVMIAGANDFNDTPALTLIPGGPLGVDSASGTGSRYALQVDYAGLLTNRDPVLQIDSLGSIRSLVDNTYGNISRSEYGREFGVPALYNALRGIWGVGLAGYNDTVSGTYHGVMIQERQTTSSTVDLVDDEMTVGGSARALVAGQCVVITAPSSHAGIYLVEDGTTDPVIMRTLAGLEPGWSNVTGATMYPLEGTDIGRYRSGEVTALGYYDGADTLQAGQNNTTSSQRIFTPIETFSDESATALYLGNVNESHPTQAAYLRCVGTSGEDFAVLASGIAVAKSSIQAPRVVGGTFAILPPRTNSFYSLSPWFYIASQPGTGLGAAAGEPSKWAYNDSGSSAGWQYSGTTPRMDLIIPITDLVPDGAICPSGRLRYATFGSYVASSVVFQLITQTNGGSITVLDSVGLPLSASPTLQTLTFGSPLQADRGLGARYAYRIHVDVSWFASSAIFIFGSDIDLSLNKL